MLARVQAHERLRYSRVRFTIFSKGWKDCLFSFPILDTFTGDLGEILPDIVALVL